MLTVDIALPEVEELQKLVETGKEKGFLTYDEIVTGIEEIELTKEQFEDFTTYLIDHVSSLWKASSTKRSPHERPLVEAAGEEPPKLDPTVEPALLAPAHLCEIGTRPLLTADLEVNLAKRIERAMSAKTQMIQANLRLWSPSPRATSGAHRRFRLYPGGLARTDPRGREFDHRKGSAVDRATWWIRQAPGRIAEKPARSASRQTWSSGSTRSSTSSAARQRLAASDAGRDRERARDVDGRGTGDSTACAAPDLAREADREEEDSELGDFFRISRRNLRFFVP